MIYTAIEQTLRGTHRCYVCGQVLSWVAGLFQGTKILHGSELSAEVTVSGRAQSDTVIECNVDLVCPACHASNQFKTLHRM